MHRPLRSPTAQSRPAGWVTAAIVVHLLVSSMASAATSCTETIERTRVTRLTHTVAPALRELVAHEAAPRPLQVLTRDDEPTPTRLIASTDHAPTMDPLSPWLLNLPPPVCC